MKYLRLFELYYFQLFSIILFGIVYWLFFPFIVILFKLTQKSLKTGWQKWKIPANNLTDVRKQY
jgi:hypothetical protein